MSQDYKSLFEKSEEDNVDLKRQLMAREEELGAVYADMNSMVDRNYQGRSTKNSKNRDDFDHANEQAIKDETEKIFRDFKFLPKHYWLAFTPDDPKSVCGRVKKVVVLLGRKFNQHLWTLRISKMLIHAVVSLRTKFSQCTQNGFRGMHCDLLFDTRTACTAPQLSDVFL